jgi:pyruvate/2-oxoglutarate dehydrogenase complex dihydrolipoamide dehydrogenase (E3) component
VTPGMTPILRTSDTSKGDTHGFLKILVEESSKRILGAPQ